MPSPPSVDEEIVLRLLHRKDLKMKRMISTLALVALALPSLAQAALPPYWDSVNKIQTALNSNEAANALQAPIVSIHQVDARQILLVSEMCSLPVYVDAIALPTPMPAPTEYLVTSVGPLFCE
jgi:hypothetical protein